MGIAVGSYVHIRVPCVRVWYTTDIPLTHVLLAIVLGVTVMNEDV